MSEETKKPNSYTSESKESAIKLAVESDHPVAATARDLGVNINTLHTWIGKYSKPKKITERTDKHTYDENKRLKKAFARVTLEQLPRSTHG